MVHLVIVHLEVDLRNIRGWLDNFHLKFHFETIVVSFVVERVMYQSYLIKFDWSKNIY